MASFNQVLLFGNLGTDPQLFETKSGKRVTNLRIATNTAFRNGEGELEERTDWHQVVVWNEQAEACATHLKKGEPVLVTGRLQMRRCTDADGNDQYVPEVVAKRVTFMRGPKGEEA